MNIYNKLFVLEYARNPSYNICNGMKCWYLNFSKQKSFYRHRDFDLYDSVCDNLKYWHIFNRLHKLIGPSIVIECNKFYYIRNKYKKYTI